MDELDERMDNMTNKVSLLTTFIIGCRRGKYITIQILSSMFHTVKVIIKRGANILYVNERLQSKIRRKNEYLTDKI